MKKLLKLSVAGICVMSFLLFMSSSVYAQESYSDSIDAAVQKLQLQLTGLISILNQMKTTSSTASVTNQTTAQNTLADNVLDDDEVWMHFLDFSHDTKNDYRGESVILEFSCGLAVIDAGGEKSDPTYSEGVLKNALDGIFARRPDLNNTVDLLAITHEHHDHMGSAIYLLNNYKVLNYIDNGGSLHGGATNSRIDPVQALVKQKGIPYFPVLTKDIPVRGLTNNIIDPLACNSSNPGVNTRPHIKALWGGSHRRHFTGNWSQRDYAVQEVNNHSVSLKVIFGETEALFTGDLQENGQDALMALHAGTNVFESSIFKISHHGVPNGVQSTFMNAVSPKYAVLTKDTINPMEIDTLTEIRRSMPLHSDVTKQRNIKFPVYLNNDKTQLSTSLVRKNLYWTGFENRDIVIKANLAGEIHVD